MREALVALAECIGALAPPASGDSAEAVPDASAQRSMIALARRILK